MKRRKRARRVKKVEVPTTYNPRMTNSQFWYLLNATCRKRGKEPVFGWIRHFATQDLTTGEVPKWIKDWLQAECIPSVSHLRPCDPEEMARNGVAQKRGPEPGPTDEEFFELLARKTERAERKKDIPALRRLSVIRSAIFEGRGLPPLWAKNELRYLDTYLAPCEAEQPIPIQWFRIAEDGYNGADEDELWWQGNIYAEDLPSERLRKKPVVRL